MTILFKTPLSERVQLAPQSIMPGESISSLVDRQAQLWGITRRDLVYQVANLHGTLANRDLDVSKDDTFLDIYSEKTGISREVLEVHRAQRSRPLLRPTRRHAYCPICFKEDLSAGHTPYFRLDWARIFLTHCRKHRCPLFDWRHVTSNGTRVLPSAWILNQRQSRKRPRAAEYLHYRQELTLAQDYSRGRQRLNHRSLNIWNKLASFEELMHQENIGAPTYSSDDNASLSESDLMKRAVLLKRAAIADGRLPVADELLSEDPMVMHFLFRREAIHQVAPSWRDLRSGMQSILCRRAIIYCMIDIRM